MNTSRERHEGYLLATDLVPSVRFTDSYTKDKTKNPDIITLQISQKKQMALQIYGKRKVLGSTCYTTHLNSIIVCPSSFKIDRDMELDKEILGEIGSQSHLFLQLNSQSSISQILQNVCKNRRAMNLMVHKNFQEMGGLALDYSEGVLTMTRGEVGMLFLCQLIPARPLLRFPGNCFQQLPVVVEEDGEFVVRYLQPVSRILTTQPEVTTCTNDFPIKFQISPNEAICQTQAGIIPCNASRGLDPGNGLREAKLKTLSKQQSEPGLVMLKDVRKAIREYLLKSNYHRMVDAAIIYNENLCRDKLFCTGTFLHDSSYRREWMRQGAGFFDWLFGTDIWQFMQVIMVIWSTYSIGTGIVSFVIRTRSTCGKRCRRFTCCQIALSLCSDLEAAINPLSLSKLDMKRKTQEHQADMDYVLNLTRMATDNISVLTNRIQALEMLNADLQSRQDRETEEQTEAVVLPKNVKKSVLARRLLNARKNRNRMYNTESTWGKRNVRIKRKSEEFKEDPGTLGPTIQLNENYSSIEETDNLLSVEPDFSNIVTTKPRLLVRHK